MFNGWFDLNFNSPWIEEILHESRNVKYVLTENKLWRAKSSTSLEQRFCELFDLDLDVGYYISVPGWSYPFHRDNTRNCAFNQLLCWPNPDYVSKMIIDRTFFDIPYRTDSLMLINTNLNHNQSNKSQTDTRYLLNIGVKNFKTFEDTREHLKSKGFGLK